MLKEKILESIENDRPIKLVVVMGGGKNYKVYSAPGINWAEVFHLQFIYKYLYPIAEIYKYGINIEFTTDDYALKIINNYKDKWIDTYHKEFEKLLKFANKNTVDNFNFSLTRSSKWYQEDKLKRQVLKQVEKFDRKSSEIQNLIKSQKNNAWNNYYFLQKNLSYQEKESLIENSILKHKAWLKIDVAKRAEYLEGKHHIPVIHRKGIANTLPIRNRRSSLVQFWKGIGVLVKFQAKVYKDIISVNKYNEFENVITFKKLSQSEMDISTLEQVPILKKYL